MPRRLCHADILRLDSILIPHRSSTLSHGGSSEEDAAHTGTAEQVAVPGCPQPG